MECDYDMDLVSVFERVALRKTFRVLSPFFSSVLLLFRHLFSVCETFGVDIPKNLLKFGPPHDSLDSK